MSMENFRETETKRFNQVLYASILEAKRFIQRAEKAINTEYGTTQRSSVKRSAMDLKQQLHEINKHEIYV